MPLCASPAIVFPPVEVALLEDSLRAYLSLRPKRCAVPPHGRHHEHA
jgi:hypothetical protein